MKTQNKTIHLLCITAFVATALWGCRKTKIHPVCFPWAPASCTISETDYNSTVEIGNYFTEHDSTMLMHDGDTLKIWGWVHDPVLSGSEDEPRLWDPHLGAWAPETGFVLLVPYEDHHGYNQSIKIRWSREFLEENPGFCQDFGNYLQKKWYVTAAMECVDMTYMAGRNACSKMGYRLHAITIDTVPVIDSMEL